MHVYALKTADCRSCDNQIFLCSAWITLEADGLSASALAVTVVLRSKLALKLRLQACNTPLINELGDRELVLMMFKRPEIHVHHFFIRY